MSRYLPWHEAGHAVAGVMLGVVPAEVVLTAAGGVTVFSGGVRADEFSAGHAVTLAGNGQAARVSQLILHAGGMAEQHAMSIAGVPLDLRMVSLWTCAGDWHALKHLDAAAGPLGSHALIGLYRQVVGPWWAPIEAVATVLEIGGRLDGRTVAEIVASSR